MNNNEVIGIITRLIETCRKGQESFRNAAENIRNSEFRRLFSIFSQQRAQFVTELEAEAHRLGGDLEHNAGPAEAAHRVSNVATFAKPDESAIIADCQRGEEVAVNSYQEALKSDLPLDVQYVVKRQYMDIKDAYDRMRILQRAA
jgi:uncharacterized protein (TIGR02284 family)